ncbi:hypothetical protein Btru_064113 [Bulinus truncatus]|nr:hypothetical protein Btru_064113 [Bulinus truncatus]
MVHPFSKTDSGTYIHSTRQTEQSIHSISTMTRCLKIFRAGPRKIFKRFLSLRNFLILFLLSLFAMCVSNMLLGGFFLSESPHKRRDVIAFLSPDDEPRNNESLAKAPTVFPQLQQKCILPKLELDDPDMKKFYQPQLPVKCPVDRPAWVYVDNGTLRFVANITARMNFTCKVFPLVRKRTDDAVAWGPGILNVTDGWRLTSDFFKVECQSTGALRSNYTEILMGVASNPKVERRLSEVKPPANGLDGLSLLVMGFDSMSRMSWLRRMRRSRDYFINKLGGLELEGYNIMGDGTPAALFPMLTGKHETELHEARRKFKGAWPVDDFPWIWKDYEKAGYVTSWADSEVFMAPFNMRLLGFRQPPTDYYTRPYYLGVELMRKNKSYAPFCQGPVPKHKVWLNWARDLFYMYGDRPKFMFHFYATLSHQDNNELMKADEDLMKFMEDLEQRGYLNRTILVILGDHGARFAKFRASVSGKLEERLPYLGFRFPLWFERRHPGLIANFKSNVKRLTTPLDVHETFRDVLRFDGAGAGNLNNRGISLFKRIPADRECAHANVSSHWCACLNWQPLAKDDEMAVTAAEAAIELINNLTAEYRNLCAKLTLGSVTLASKVSPNEDMLRFKQSSDAHGRVAQFTERADNTTVLYQVTFFTRPGEGQFEVTVTHSTATDEMGVSEREISRINEYGSSPACIMDKNRQLRQYCYCDGNPQ